MGVQVIDTKKILSKHQIQKIKKLVMSLMTEGNIHEIKDIRKYVMNHVIPLMTYTTKEDSYNNADITKEEHVIISFNTIEKTDLHAVLRNKIKEKTNTRKATIDKDTRLWKTYEQLKKIIPPSNKIKIPNPEEVRSQASLFEQLIQQMPACALKNYIEECISS